MRREFNSYGPILKMSCKLPTCYGFDDFDAIAVLDGLPRKCRTPHDAVVFGDGYAARRRLDVFEQLFNSQTVGQFALLTVNGRFHTIPFEIQVKNPRRRRRRPFR